MFNSLKRKYKLWKAKRLSNKLTKETIRAGITEEELREEVYKIQQQIKNERYMKEILKHGYETQEWKIEACFDKNKPLCLDCVSGGSMLWAFCTDVEEEYNKKFNANLVKEE